ncbi:MAG: isoaspartyl peptidase/L-asparaginase [Flavobacteriales bacterium]|nr:isoaspartyl peptidase/L-asparaginase [Flavobacteriales bacterium]
MKKFTIAIHGGAGTISRTSMTPGKETEYTNALHEALNIGYAVLERGGASLDAVESAVMSLENCPLFNAGRGSVFTHEGHHEMDASIMGGDTLAAGAVAIVRSVQNPISLARAVMEHSEHVMLCGEGAEVFARKQNLSFQPKSYFNTEHRHQQLLKAKEENTIQLDHSGEKKFGTVGAVALDANGNLAAATSTGGMTNKQWGRIGDTPIIGAGTYANNKTCAVSCTGHGEFFIRAVVAYDVSCLMEYGGMSLQEASQLVINEKLVKLGGEGGFIAIDASGNICLPFNSEGMYRGWRRAGEMGEARIYKED